MTIVFKNNKLLIFSSASALFHGIIVYLFILLSNVVPDYSSFNNPPSSFKIKKISRSVLNKIRRAGVIDGSTVNNSPNYLKTTPGTSKKNPHNSLSKNSLSLKDLSTQKLDTNKFKKTKASIKPKSFDRALFSPTPQSQMFNKRIHKDLQETSPISSLPGYLGTDFYSHIVPPKGISPDEFNTLEKTFYGFIRREKSTFYSTFYKLFNESKIKKPQLIRALKGKDRTTLRIIRDSEGNLVSIKVMKAAVSDDIHEFILEVFKAIPKIQNVPKELLDNGKYQVYWEIKFNSRL